MDTTQKTCFLALCEHKNITKTAEALFLSRQALSVRIRKLEEELGVPLFIRKKEGVVLTEYGELLHKCLKKQDQLWHNLQLQIETIKNENREPLRFVMRGVTNEPDYYRYVLAFETEHPNTNIQLINADLPDALRMLENGKVDLISAIYATDHPLFYRVQATDCPFRLIVGKSSPLAALAEIDFMKDLEGQTLLYEGNYLPESFLAICKSLGIRTQSIHASRTVISELIGWNKACLYMLEPMCARFESEHVCSRPLRNLPLDINAYLIYRPDASRNLRALIHHIYRYYNGGRDTVLPDETE